MYFIGNAVIYFILLYESFSIIEHKTMGVEDVSKKFEELEKKWGDTDGSPAEPQGQMQMRD